MMSGLEKFVPWLLLLTPVSALMAWRFYRNFKQSGETAVRELVMAQLALFAAIYLSLAVLELSGYMTGQMLDYLSLTVIIIFVVFGSAMTFRAVRKAEENRKKGVIKYASGVPGSGRGQAKSSGKKPGAKKAEIPASSKKVAKNKKKKG